MIRKKAEKKAPRRKSKPDPAEIVSIGSVDASEAAFAETQEASGNGSEPVSRRERIAMLAYSYWEQRGCQGGSPEEDWFRAEREIDLPTPG